MSYYFNELPAEPHRRRVLVVMDRVAAEEFIRTPPGAAVARDDEVALLGWTSIVPRTGDVLLGLERDGRLPERGVRMVLNPFEDRDYRPVAPAVERLPVSKAYALRTLCQRLGAATFRCELGHKTTSDSEWRAGAAASAPKGGGELLLKRALANLASEQAVIEGKYGGAMPDFAAVEEFRRLAGAHLDPDFAQVIREATYQANPPTELAVSIDVEHEVRSLLSLLARVKVPSVAEASADLALESKESVRHFMRVRVTWNRTAARR